MRIGIYARVSTYDKQDINTQLEFLRRYSEIQNLEITAIFQDIGISGSKESRPEFDKLLTALRRRELDGVLVYKLDRIGRSLAHLVKLFEEFRAKNILFISATQNINTSTPEGRMFLNVLMVMAEYERELTIDRVASGMARARAEGKPIGKRGSDRKPRKKAGYWLRSLKKREGRKPSFSQS